MGKSAQPHSFRNLPESVREALRTLVRALADEAAEAEYRQRSERSGVRHDKEAS
jgi:hypothetical protein